MNEKIINKILFSITVILSVGFLVLISISFSHYFVNPSFNNIKTPLEILFFYLLGVSLSLIIPVRFIQKYLSRAFYYFTILLGVFLIFYFLFLPIYNHGSNNIYLTYFGTLLNALFIYLIASGFFLAGFIRVFKYKK